MEELTKCSDLKTCEPNYKEEYNRAMDEVHKCHREIFELRNIVRDLSIMLADDHHIIC